MRLFEPSANILCSKMARLLALLALFASLSLTDGVPVLAWSSTRYLMSSPLLSSPHFAVQLLQQPYPNAFWRLHWAGGDYRRGVQLSAVEERVDFAVYCPRGTPSSMLPLARFTTYHLIGRFRFPLAMHRSSKYDNSFKHNVSCMT